MFEMTWVRDNAVGSKLHSHLLIFLSGEENQILCYTAKYCTGQAAGKAI